MKNYSEIVTFLPDSDQSTKPLSPAQQRRRRKQEHKPKRYQPVVIVETEVLVVDAELLMAMLLLGRLGR